MTETNSYDYDNDYLAKINKLLATERILMTGGYKIKIRDVLLHPIRNFKRWLALDIMKSGAKEEERLATMKANLQATNSQAKIDIINKEINELQATVDQNREYLVNTFNNYIDSANVFYVDAKIAKTPKKNIESLKKGLTSEQVQSLQDKLAKGKEKTKVIPKATDIIGDSLKAPTEPEVVKVEVAPVAPVVPMANVVIDDHTVDNTIKTEVTSVAKPMDDKTRDLLIANTILNVLDDSSIKTMSDKNKAKFAHKYMEENYAEIIKEIGDNRPAVNEEAMAKQKEHDLIMANTAIEIFKDSALKDMSSQAKIEYARKYIKDNYDEINKEIYAQSDEAKHNEYKSAIAAVAVEAAHNLDGTYDEKEISEYMQGHNVPPDKGLNQSKKSVKPSDVKPSDVMKVLVSDLKEQALKEQHKQEEVVEVNTNLTPKISKAASNHPTAPLDDPKLINESAAYVADNQAGEKESKKDSMEPVVLYTNPETNEKKPAAKTVEDLYHELMDVPHSKTDTLKILRDFMEQYRNKNDSKESSTIDEVDQTTTSDKANQSIASAPLTSNKDKSNPLVVDVMPNYKKNV